MNKVMRKTNISGGSDAATYIIELVTGEKYFKKEASGNAAKKLCEQLEWLRSVQYKIPVPKTLGADWTKDSEGKLSNFEYFMPYEENVKTLGKYILDGGETEKIFAEIFESIDTIYGKTRKPTKEEILEYYNEKVKKNLEIVEKYYDDTNLNVQKLIAEMFDWNHFYDIMKNDKIAETAHGDLTAENIIVCPDGSFYFIDSNSGNMMNSKFLDYGKFLQSVHGNYELLMKEKANIVNFNDAVKYGNAFDSFVKVTNLTDKEMLICYYHELIHWLRLIPYKVKSNYAPEAFINRFFELVEQVSQFENPDEENND